MELRCRWLRRRARVGMSALLLLALVGCGGPVDKKLVTGGSNEQYRSSVDIVDPGLSDHERAAFNWAVSDLDLPTLHRRYPNGTVRQVIRGEIKRVQQAHTTRLERLKRKVQAQAPLIAELEKVTARDVQLQITTRFFGAKPTVKATLGNASGLPLSSIKWRAALYLDGADKPAASAIVISDFQGIGGLKPGNESQAVFNIGFVTGDAA